VPTASSRSKARAAAISDRRRQAIQLRIAGVDLTTIADRLDYSSPQAVSVDITRALEQTTKALQVDADQLRAIELERLDRLQAGVWTRAINGDDKAVLSALRIMQRRARLLGLDAPVKVKTEVTSELDREIEDLVTRLAGSRRRPDHEQAEDDAVTG
jgi:hypothetical protein